jgi:hypothetical protein
MSVLLVLISMSLIEDDTTDWKNWKSQLLLPLTVKSFIKSVYKPFKQLHKLFKKLKPRRISLPNPQSITIKLNFYMIRGILLICIETNLDGKVNFLIASLSPNSNPEESALLKSLLLVNDSIEIWPR